MYLVTCYSQFLGKTLATLSFLSRKPQDKAIELAFMITNAPEECLSEAMRRWQTSLFRRYKFKGPCVTVGDIVLTEHLESRSKKAFRCEPMGWKQVSIYEVLDLPNLS